MQNIQNLPKNECVMLPRIMFNLKKKVVYK